MRVHISEPTGAMAEAAAARAIGLLRAAISTQGSAALILATGASQFEMLDNLTRAELAGAA
jgi:glucosamine-6-phosphate deaminase